MLPLAAVAETVTEHPPPPEEGSTHLDLPADSRGGGDTHTLPSLRMRASTLCLKEIVPSSSALMAVTQPVTYFRQAQDKPLPLRPYLEKLKRAHEASTAFLGSLLSAEPSWGTAQSDSCGLTILPSASYHGQLEA